jgi:ATP synthase F1 complex assembly factor 2
MSLVWACCACKQGNKGLGFGLLWSSPLKVGRNNNNKGAIQAGNHNNLFMSTRRFLHKSSVVTAAPKQKVTSKDTRIAGRLRFYKHVGVMQVSAPWQEQEPQSSPKQEVVESPISAGVDGTASASGVSYPPKDSADKARQLEYMLSPRKPGSNNNNNSDDKQKEGCWFGVSLDGRTLKSPMGQTLAVPSQKLAYAIAAEWNAQKKHLQPTQMPLMTLACTALDQVSMHPKAYQEQALNYLPTDTTCFWSDPTQDRVLHRRQEQAWSDLHAFVENKFHHKPAMALGANEGMRMARKREKDSMSKAGLPHPPELYEQAEHYIKSLDAWHLVAFHAICSQAKSFLVALAVLEQGHASSHTSKSSELLPLLPFKGDLLSKAIQASRVEEEFQIASWGLVEGGHDYDRLNCSIQLHSAHFLARTITMDNDF